MERDDLSKTDSSRLARLMQTASGAQSVWQDQDLTALLEHLLKSPVEAEIRGLAGATGMSFGEALTAAPVSVLEAIKQFAKASRVHPDGALPREAADALYLASIVAARVRCGTCITTLDDISLRKSIAHALQSAWVGPLRELFKKGLGAFDDVKEGRRETGDRNEGGP